jgi:hypothetical protein
MITERAVFAESHGAPFWVCFFSERRERRLKNIPLKVGVFTYDLMSRALTEH